MVHFQVAYKSSDLDIGIPRDRYLPTFVGRAQAIVRAYHRQLQAYIDEHPAFGFSLVPCAAWAQAPAIAKDMAAAAELAGVGPMAAVAGAVAQYTALDLVGDEAEIIIENGGDIYLNTSKSRTIGIFTGEGSVFNNRLALKVKASSNPMGICTSSGTVGPALSFGCADAAIIIAKSPILADAVATATGNRVKEPADVGKAASFAASIPGVLGAVVMAQDNIAAWGEVELRRTF
jgi:ApbE superfamily uncharacterized protein (UPF0280 family)